MILFCHIVTAPLQKRSHANGQTICLTLRMSGTYRPSGTGRDAYIAGRARATFVQHDINARRDNLPDNVFQYMRDQWAREKYEAYVYETQTANARASNGLSGGKRIAGQQAARDEDHVLMTEDRALVRHLRLKALYDAEMQSWKAELSARGLCIEA